MQRSLLASRPRLRSESRPGFWAGPLGYAQAWAAVGGALVLGLLFHWQIGYPGGAPSVGLLWLAAAPAAAALFAGRLLLDRPFVKWLCGIPMAIASTVVVGVLALAGGIVPNSFFQEQLGAPSMWASYPFLMSCSLMMVNLVGSVGKRLWPLNYKNVVYLASHAGLAVAIGGGAVSASMLERQNIVLFPGQKIDFAFDAQDHQHPLPFAIELEEFVMETFDPRLSVVTLDDKAKDGYTLESGSAFAVKGANEAIDGFRVEVLESHDKAVFNGEKWIPVEWKTAGPAARVRVSGADGSLLKEGWVSAESVEAQAAFLQLEEGRLLAMEQPRPKRFASKVKVHHNGATTERMIEVNEPIHVAGRTLYQLSYDDKAGPASAYSVIESVEDKGLPVVYAGIFIMLAGAALHLWNGVGGKA